MIILGVDPGVADTGYGIIKFVGNQWDCLTFGTIKTSAQLALPQRLEIIYQQINQLIKQFKPQLAALEQLFFCKNTKTALMVGQARGAIIIALQKNRLPLHEFTPLQIKQAVAAYGRASKIQVQKMVQLILGLKKLPQPDDAADALAAAICAAHSLKINSF
ncbi:crossover junction endodeoxyribonuclease RuvC [Candidatus Parcubacteria bacterium]|nr:MAG: crossover junction endodeoxyribonuclease RuvC [Candidatus Parcubacteria bacterium]